MSNWKTKLIQAYRWSSIPYRQFRWINMSRRGSVPVMVLFYHRIADDHLNDWSMTNADFEQQIDWFQENFDLVDLEEAQNRIRSGDNSRPTLSITFDDGYAENCERALPMLIERKIPVTYFVTTHHTSNQAPFPHDVALDCPLPANTIDSLAALSAAGVEIGAHTRNHADLGKIDDQRVLVDEVIAASLELEAMVGSKIRYFAFPFGQVANLNSTVFSLLREAGFLGVCSAYGGWNEIGDDAFHIQRLHGDPNIQRIKNWLTYDPRIGRVPRFQPADDPIDMQLLRETMQRSQTASPVVPVVLSDPNVQPTALPNSNH